MPAHTPHSQLGTAVAATPNAGLRFLRLPMSSFSGVLPASLNDLDRAFCHNCFMTANCFTRVHYLTIMVRSAQSPASPPLPRHRSPSPPPAHVAAQHPLLVHTPSSLKTALSLFDGPVEARFRYHFHSLEHRQDLLALGAKLGANDPRPQATSGHYQQSSMQLNDS
jgi:hypothetical protein